MGMRTDVTGLAFATARRRIWVRRVVLAMPVAVTVAGVGYLLANARLNHSGAAAALAVVPAVTLTVMAVLVLYLGAAPYRARRVVPWAAAGMFGVGFAVQAGIAAESALSVPVPAAALIGLLGLPVGLLAGRRIADEQVRRMLRNHSKPAPAPADAEAVIHACRQLLAGRRLRPSEWTTLNVNLARALLQVGVAGVVASHWAADDRYTAFLMVKFYELWCVNGLSPTRALAGAQRWLRAATLADLNAYLPGVLTVRSPESAARRATAHPYRWAAFALTGV
jgi:hypothetical protein